MVLLEIKKPVKFNPIKWGASDLYGLREGQSYVSYGVDHLNNPEHGSVEISVNDVRGELLNISDLIFVLDEAVRGKLIGWKKNILGNLIIDVQFESVFGSGLKYSAQNFILKGGVIIGFSEDEKKLLKDIKGQRELLLLLVDFIIPNRSTEILKFARPALICIPNEDRNEKSSHFLGKPKHDLDDKVDGIKEASLFHLATILLDEFDEELLTSYKICNQLSFYLRIDNSRNGWPEEIGEHKVLNDKGTNQSANVFENYFEIASNFDSKVILDIPWPDDTVIYKLDLSKDEEQRYEALKSVYMNLILPDLSDMGVNKVFGYPDSVQQCVSYEAERISKKMEYGDDVFNKADDWLLLLQVSADCKSFDFFDDFGHSTIYFMIQKADLVKGNFDNCQVIVQNT